MKATKNNDGTINLTGMTELEAFSLLALTGNICGGYGTTDQTFNALNTLFPKYIDNYFNHKIINSNVYFNKKEAEAALEKCREVKRVIQTPVSAQRRDANGRFEKKVWVARFVYPDSKNRYYHVPRTVITNESGRFSPNFIDSIEGVDLARGAFRKFSAHKIIGLVKWTKEYASDVQ